MAIAMASVLFTSWAVLTKHRVVAGALRERPRVPTDSICWDARELDEEAMHLPEFPVILARALHVRAITCSHVSSYYSAAWAAAVTPPQHRPWYTAMLERRPSQVHAGESLFLG